MVRIGHASIDENGRISGGIAGDQTGKEVCIRSWYAHSKGWVVLRCKDAVRRKRIAEAMEKACNNPQIGYDQYQRGSLYTNVSGKGYDPSKTTKAVETDCSALVRVCIAYAYGEDKVGNIRTVDEPATLVKTGLFEKLTADKYCKSSDYLLRGDILCTPVSGHTAVVLDDGAKVQVSVSAPTTTTQKEGTKVYMKTLREGDKGPQVVALQRILIGYGGEPAKIIKASGGADGKFGVKTGDALEIYQKENNDADGKQLKPDREAGEKTWGSMLGQ